jgi:uncharacterized protein (DUF58 family)
LNFARLNHILIPNTKEDRDRFRTTRFSRVFVRPIARTYLALTDEGRGLLGLSMLASLMGLDVIHGQNHLLWALSFSLLVASLSVRPLFRLRGVQVDVEGPRRVSVGGAARFRVSLANDGERAHHSLRVTRPFLPWDGSWIEGDASLVELPQRGRQTLGLTARFVARGHHHIDSFGVGALVPLGLAVGPSLESAGTRFVVVPRICPVAGIALSDRPRHQQGGVAMASHTGESMELVGLRPYRDGDRIRDLHAKTWARLGTPMVREYQQEYFSRIAVVLDLDGEEAGEEQLESAISLTAGVLQYLVRGEALIDLQALGHAADPLTIGRSLAGFDQALDRLADLQAGPAFDAEESFRVVRGWLRQLSALVYVTPAWDESRRGWVERIRRSGVPCRVVVVAARQESSAGSDSCWVEPEDVERAMQAGEGLVL